MARDEGRLCLSVPCPDGPMWFLRKVQAVYLSSPRSQTRDLFGDSYLKSLGSKLEHLLKHPKEGHHPLWQRPKHLTITSLDATNSMAGPGLTICLCCSTS